jgi:hypothetical protein
MTRVPCVRLASLRRLCRASDLSSVTAASHEYAHSGLN